MGDQLKEAAARAGAIKAEGVQRQGSTTVDDYYQQWQLLKGPNPQALASTTNISTANISPGAGQIIHHFTGEVIVDDAACGVELAVDHGAPGGGLVLTGARASTSAQDVTCVACLRALLAKKLRKKAGK